MPGRQRRLVIPHHLLVPVPWCITTMHGLYLKPRSALSVGTTPAILIVEDEADLAATIAYNFQREGFRAETEGSGRAALERLSSGQPLPDLVILDLMLPDLMGMDVLRQLRAQRRTASLPVVIVTAKGEEIDRVVGFEVGADDYVVKPFSVRELVLRVRTILRRAELVSEPASGRVPAVHHAVAATPHAHGDSDAQIAFGRLRIDGEGHRVWVDGQEQILTALEFKLLVLLMQRRGRVQSRERLLRDVWDIQADVTTRTVDTHVKRLRQKLGAAADYVETLRGVGYRFRSHPDQAGSDA